MIVNESIDDRSKVIVRWCDVIIDNSIDSVVLINIIINIIIIINVVVDDVVVVVL